MSGLQLMRSDQETPGNSLYEWLSALRVEPAKASRFERRVGLRRLPNGHIGVAPLRYGRRSIRFGGLGESYQR